MRCGPRRQAREVASLFVERGIRTGRELKFVRKAAGLRAVELAALLDVRPETVSRWERDEQPVPRQSAYIVGQLLEHPRQTRHRLWPDGWFEWLAAARAGKTVEAPKRSRKITARKSWP